MILLYSGVKGYDPRDVIRYGLGGKKPEKMKTQTGEDALERGREHPEGNPDPGQRHPGDGFYPPGTENGGEPTTPATYPGIASV
jgi:hypothetical protein